MHIDSITVILFIFTNILLFLKAFVLYFFTHCPSLRRLLVDEERMRKGKEKKSIYIVPFILCIVSKRSDMDHTVLPANYTMPALPS